ncbi:MAG TPA: coenzyme F420-0:L-glutamate ligase [Solirubrobacterales bacterium]|nr:coenzyme F420-0:L-glutamate ligase [Solirubrobacterales bacterium]
MIELHPVTGLPEVTPGDDLAGLLAERAQLDDRDILVVAQKVVSKAEGRLRDMREITPSSQALEIAHRNGSDPRQVQAVIDESVRLVRTERVIIAETRHGFVCANAGVDHSNVPGGEILCLLPVDPDASAAALRDRLRELTGRSVAVIVSDTFGRAWRIGIQNVALGVAGMPAVVDYRGRDDDFGRTMVGTVIAIADELAGAAELVMGKTDRVPAVVIRGYRAEGEPGTGRQLIRPAEEDMFR